MKLNTTDFRRKCQHPLLLAFGSIPAALVVILGFAPEWLERVWCFPAAYTALAWGCMVLPGSKRLPAGIAGAGMLIALAFFLLPVRENFFLILLPLMYAALLLATLPIGGWPRSRELAVGWHVSGTLLYVLIQILINVSASTGEGGFDRASLPVVVCFLVYAGLMLLALNRSSLDSAALSRRAVPVLMRRQNVIITFVLLVLSVLIAAIPVIGSLLEWGWNLLLRGVAHIVLLLAAFMPQPALSGGGAPAPMEQVGFSAGEPVESSLLMEILEKVLVVIALLLLAALVFFAGRALLKKLIKLMKYLWSRLSVYSAAAGEDYEDEITDTRDEPDTDRTGLLGRLRRMSRTDERGMTPTQRVRYRYMRLKRKHADWTSASTARETLPENAAALYERARYGGQELTGDEAERFREDTRRV